MQELLKKVSGAQTIEHEERIQMLWSNYGEIKRYYLSGGNYPTLIVKHFELPKKKDHPKGWNTKLSHQRKKKSYKVELCWYRDYAHLTNNRCKVPGLIYDSESEGESFLILEDLNAIGFSLRYETTNVGIFQAKACIIWLANFHARFISFLPKELWEQGCYWHLDTRPDELAKMKDLELQKAAPLIDAHLRSAKYQTLVHGDAKLANFCFSERGDVAAVDFQYVGKGCGMKDLAYFISSCFDGKECERHADELLDFYFKELSTLLDRSINFQELKEEWSKLYAFAWADFYRFIDGWSPGHWKVHSYSKKQRDKVLKMINET